MQNFTLGRMGNYLSFFAFILFSVTHSYGQQSCSDIVVTDQNDTASGNQQYFCDSQEAEISDLLIEGDTGNVAVYAELNSTEPLDSTDLLVGGEDYFVGTSTVNCGIGITVTIFNEPEILGVEEGSLTRRPEANNKQSLGTLGLCVADVDNPNVFVGDLRTNAPEGTIQWYRSETLTGEPQPIANPNTEELRDNTYYYAERVYSDPVDSELNCTTNRARTLVLLTATDAPEADREQEFCASNDPVVGDIVASGENRYYASATGQVEISRNEPLENGRTYYVSTLGQTCESELRSPVTVELQGVYAGEDNTAELCQGELQERLDAGESVRDIFISYLVDGDPTDTIEVSTDGTFSNASLEEIAAAYSSNPYQTFETTYTVTNETGCTDSAEIALTVNRSFDAGENNTSVTLCRSELPATLTEETARNFFLSLLSEDADTGGEFSNESITVIVDNFNSGDGTGTFSTLYTVGTGTCEDTAELAVTVEDANAGADNTSTTFCRSELEAQYTEQQIRDFFVSLLSPDANPNGTFTSSTIAEITETFNSGDGTGTFSTVYTVGEGTACEDTALLSVTVQEPSAGEDNTTANFCRSELPETLTETEARNFFLTLLSEDADTNGTFTNQTIQEITAAFNDGDATGTYSTTYVVGQGTECQDTAQLAVTINESGNAGEDADLVFCQSEVETLVAEFLADPNQDPEAFLADWIGNRDTNGSFSGDPLTSIITQYQTGNWPIEVSTTYTVGEGTQCEDSAEISLTITEGGNAVADNSATICNADVPVIFEQVPEDVVAYYIDLAGGTEGGTFEPSIQELIAQYNRNSIDDFTTTYTVGEGTECEDSAVLTLTITDELPADAGDDRTLTFCTSEGPQDLASFITPGANEDGTFTGDLDQTFDPATVGAGTYTVTYTVDDTSACVTQGDVDTASFTITITEGGNAVADNSATICNADVPVIFEQVPEDVVAYYIDLAGGTEGGTFEPSIQELIAQYNRNSIDDFTTTYTVGEGTECEDSAVLTLTITDELPADAGDDRTLTFCTSEGPQDLASFITPGANEDGTFTGDLDQTFDPATVGAGTYTVTYTVDDTSACVTEGDVDTASFTITITEGGNTVADNSATICNADVPAIFEQVPEDVVAYYIDLAGGTEGGTFEPSIQELIAQYNRNSIDDFTTTYTVGEGTECEDSAVLTVTITDEESPAVVQDIADFSTCTEATAITLSTLLVGNTTTGGTFTVDGTTATTFNPAMGVGTYQVTYSVNGDDLECVTGQASDSFVIAVTDEESPAVVQDIADFSTCTEATAITLSTLLVGNTTKGGTFTVDGTTATSFDPAMGTGTYQVTYSVNGDDLACVAGEASDSFVITVTDEESPAVVQDIADFSTCTEATAITLSTLLVGNTTKGGTFTVDGTTATTFDPAMGVGTYQVTYSVNGDDLECVTGQASDSFVITVTDEESPAVVQDIADFSTCTEATAITLSTLLVGNTTTGGTFTVDGTPATSFDPAMGTGTYQVTYSVNGDDLACVAGEASDSFVITVTDEESPAVVQDIADFSTCTEATAITLSTLLVGNTTKGGTFTVVGTTATTFDPAMGVGTYQVTYSVNGDDLECVTGQASDSFVITVTDEESPAIVEDIADFSTCTEATAITLSTLLVGNTTTGGTFTVDGTPATSFDPAMGTGTYQVTYSVNGDDLVCVTGQASDSFVITITEGLSAGSDNSTTLCNADIKNGMFNGNSLGKVTNFYLDLLDEGVSREGTFEPTIQSLIDRYNNEDEIGTFATQYTVSNGECEDSVELSLVITEGIPAEIGEITDITLCGNVEDQQLVDFLPEGTPTTGTFEGYEDGVFSPSTLREGSYEITYTLDESAPCVNGEASATFTITVLPAANAGMDMEIDVCTNEGPQDLTQFLSADADTNGVFTLEGEVIVDGQMNPADFEPGTYTVLYTVPAENDCGEDTAELVITISTAPAAPTVTDLTFCAIEGATVADLGVTGDNITYYSNVELTDELESTDVLVEQPYYVTDRSSEGGCVSEAAIIMVAINDAPTPTIDQTQLELCVFDNNTLADLNAAVNETGDIRWYASEDGSEALSANTPLEDGVTYYAALFDDTAECESSQRLSYTVQLEDCDLVFPEGISPNDDGRNDRFIVENIAEKYPNYNLEIFNRWGNTVYTGNANTPAWDGTSQSGGFGDGVLPVGVYFYVIDFNDGVTPPKQGKIYLSL